MEYNKEWEYGTPSDCDCENNFIQVDCGCKSKEVCECENILLEISKLKSEDVVLQREIDAISGASISGVTEEEVDAKIAVAKTEIEAEIPSLSGYATEQWVEDKHYITGVDLSDYALKSEIPVVPTSNTAFTNDAGYITGVDLSDYATQEWVIDQHYITGVDLSDYATKQWVEDKNYITMNDIHLKTINGESISGTGNIQIETSGAVDSQLSTTSINPVQNKVITGALNGKLDASAYTAPVQSDWNATSGLAFIKNKPTIPTVPTNVSAFNNDAGYITSSSTIFNNYYTTGNTYNKTQVNNLITNLQNQINSLIESFEECCTATTLMGNAVIKTTSTTQIVDIGSDTNIQVFKSPTKTVYPVADGKDSYSLGSTGNVPCTFKLIEGLTYLGSGTAGRWTSAHSIKYQFNGGFTKVAQDCFSGSTLLQELDFHDGVNEIGTRAFDACNALTTLTFRSATPPTLIASSNRTALDTLNDTNTSFVIKVPSTYLNAYKAASGWSTYSSRIQAIV